MRPEKQTGWKKRQTNKPKKKKGWNDVRKKQRRKTAAKDEDRSAEWAAESSGLPQNGKGAEFKSKEGQNLNGNMERWKGGGKRKDKNQNPLTDNKTNVFQVFVKSVSLCASIWLADGEERAGFVCISVNEKKSLKNKQKKNLLQSWYCSSSGCRSRRRKRREQRWSKKGTRS